MVVNLLYKILLDTTTRFKPLHNHHLGCFFGLSRYIFIWRVSFSCLCLVLRGANTDVTFWWYLYFSGSKPVLQEAVLHANTGACAAFYYFTRRHTWHTCVFAAFRHVLTWTVEQFVQESATRICTNKMDADCLSMLSTNVLITRHLSLFYLFFLQ